MNYTREIKRLYHKEKYSVNQVAEILGCSTYLVKSKLGDTLRTPKEAGEIRSTRLFFGYIPEAFKGNDDWDD